MEMIKRSRALVAAGISPQMIKGCIAQHRKELERMNRLYDYYRGFHAITKRGRKGNNAPNNRIANSYPKYITDIVCGYMFANPINYSAPENVRLDDIKKALRLADIDTHDAELGKNISVFGVGYELLYMAREADPYPKAAVIDPRCAFVVYDDTVMCQPMFGVCYFPKYDEQGKTAGYAVDVYTDSLILHYTMDKPDSAPVAYGEPQPHYFGGVPLTEYWNNDEGQGDYEQALSLIDALDVLTSDRINDKEQFVNAILIISNGEFDLEQVNQLNDAILSLPDGADAKYLIKTLNESETQVLAKAISQAIHKFSMTPDFTDEQFSGNSSGVALGYKLLPLEYMTKTKERFYIEGLRERLRMFANVLAKKGLAKVDTSEIAIAMNRLLPVNELENAQKLALLKNAGLRSVEGALEELPSVKDKKAELERIRQEQLDTVKSRAQLFGAADSVDGIRM